MLYENSQDFNAFRKAFHERQARGQKLENTFSQVKLASFTETIVTICFLLPLCSYNTVQNYHVQRKWTQRGEKKDYLQQFYSPPFTSMLYLNILAVSRAW